MTAALLVARVGSADDLLALARAARDLGFATLDAHAPHTVEGLGEALALPPSPVRPLMLVGGLGAAAAIFAYQYWTSVHGYPINSGGRPLNSWPAFLFATFETGVLGAALAGFAGFLWSCGLPRPSHPFFEAAAARAVTDDGYALTLDPRDPRARVDALDILRARPEILSVEVIG
ncbi:DUF3341 domain-containing protein [uncultured Jannaschia sp.]|uniref:DUF3341 domain-containing protein n=1 Tax=uncultured Jannaschia sp. TaxID=293347 RepID=UPI002614475F|nr:DUF3341 domain-containing protein [uncultured Jannaschia sp.]